MRDSIEDATTRKLEGRVARQKSIRAQSDAALPSNTKLCPNCNRPFTNRKKWSSRGLWPSIVYCSKSCQKKFKNKQAANKV